MNISLDKLRRLVRQRLFAGDVQETDPNSWMVPYGNLMTVLMIFFMVLYAFACLNQEKCDETINEITVDVASPAEQARKHQELDRIKKLEYFIYSGRYEKYMEIQLLAQKIMITLKEPVLFDSGDDRLKASAYPALAVLGEFMSATPGKVNIEGHTDDLPIQSARFASNWELAAARSYAIMNYFVHDALLDPARFMLLSHASYSPVAPNDSAENRARNRRIEISITRDRDAV